MKKLYIIESLREGDEKTGEKIAGIFSTQIYTRYYSCSSISDIETSFWKIMDDVAPGDEVMLSIEVHGDREGIQLSDMNQMLWNEVASFLKEVNIKTEMGLYVLASSCFGQYLDTAITIKDRAPFYKSYGPDKKIEGDCIVRYNTAIIRDFIDGKDLSQTIDQENSQPNKTNAIYVACDCVQLYKKVAIKYYKENLLSQNVIVRGIINMPQIEIVAKERGETIEETLKNYVSMLLDKKHNEDLFYKFMDHFLMTDKNSPYALEKASLSFDECWTEDWQNSYNNYMR